MEYSQSAASGLVDIVTDPSKALIAADKEQGRMWVPFILAILAPLVLMVYYFSTVDMDWMFQQMQAAAALQGNEIPDEMRDIFSPTMMMITGGVSSVIIITLMVALGALYLFIVSKISTEDTRSYGNWFSLSAWCTVPNTLGAVVMIVYFAVLGSNQVGIEELSFFSLNALVTHYPAGTQAASFFSGITPFMFWSIGLLAFGLKLWTGRTMAKSLLIVAAPYVVIYGIWGAFIL